MSPWCTWTRTTQQCSGVSAWINCVFESSCRSGHKQHNTHLLWHATWSRRVCLLHFTVGIIYSRLIVTYCTSAAVMLLMFTQILFFCIIPGNILKKYNNIQNSYSRQLWKHHSSWPADLQYLCLCVHIMASLNHVIKQNKIIYA